MPLFRKTRSAPPIRMWRQHLMLCMLLAVFVVLGARVVHLQTNEHERLQMQGDARHLREITAPPQRGRILDRHGHALAVSTPVDSLWARPAAFCAAPERWGELLEVVGMAGVRVEQSDMQARCARHGDSDFMYIKRRLPPTLIKRALQLAVPGVDVQREYKRYYPAGPAGAQLIGFTDVDDIGQEGLERSHQSHLGGRAGRIRVLKDQAGNYVESVESIRQVRHGQDLVISIDQRIQSLVSEYLETAVRRYRAAGGSVVVLSALSGEILAMVNSPQFNPNDRRTITGGKFRNRSITDLFEPGSTVKPFTIAMALESGKVSAADVVDTTPGSFRVGDETIEDVDDYGELSVADVLVRSSNIGAAKIALALPYEDLFDAFAKAGFGGTAGLPGEQSGALKRRTQLIEHATLAYGYGVSTTALQLARAYTVFATDGELLPVTLQPKPNHWRAKGKRVLNRPTVHAIRRMLEDAASPAGTGRKARVPRYRIGGKTGTTHKLENGEYLTDRYQSTFVGIAPLTEPRFVVVVFVDDPREEYYFGGDVAAPVFAKITADLMRLYNIKPDARPPVTVEEKGEGA